MNEFLADRASPVTSRERDVLGLLARGCTYSRIAERLGISPHTVSSHIKSVYRKLGVRCAAAAVMRAVELRLLCGNDGPPIPHS